ncbi:MAG TPA: DUF6457 domain-containing protein [Acidimicrobiales bacterium]|nr:DUF6457 domain-containing protein [Acidimicrobiales bacterium]
MLANPLPCDPAAALHRDPGETGDELDAEFRGDGRAWRVLAETYRRASPALLDALCTPLPPVRPTVRTWRALGTSGLLRLGRLGLAGSRRLGEEEFGEIRGRLLLAGCAAHSDPSPESAGSGFVGWFLAMLGQAHGFPVPRAGAGELTAALVRRLAARGGNVACGQRVEEILVARGRARGVRAADGSRFRARRAVVADVAATSLFGELLDERLLPRRLPGDLARFHWDPATVKVDWRVRDSVPWRAPVVRRAGTVHLTHGVDELTRASAELAMGTIPTRPFVLVGQPAAVDPTRASAGHVPIWAYAHVPHQVRADPYGVLCGIWDETELATFADRLESRIEAHAPGFRGSGRSPVSGARRRRSPASTLRPPRPIPVVACTVRAGGTRGARHSARATGWEGSPAAPSSNSSATSGRDRRVQRFASGRRPGIGRRPDAQPGHEDGACGCSAVTQSTRRDRSAATEEPREIERGEDAEHGVGAEGERVRPRAGHDRVPRDARRAGVERKALASVPLRGYPPAPAGKPQARRVGHWRRGRPDVVTTDSQPTGSQPTGSQTTDSQPTGSQPTGSQPNGSQPTASEWAALFALELGTTPPTEREADDLLAIAGVAAHASERTAAPLSAWLVGRARVSPAEARDAAARVASKLKPAT